MAPFAGVPFCFLGARGSPDPLTESVHARSADGFTDSRRPMRAVWTLMANSLQRIQEARVNSTCKGESQHCSLTISRTIS
jgi:hypothetical protein